MLHGDQTAYSSLLVGLQRDQSQPEYRCYKYKGSYLDPNSLQPLWEISHLIVECQRKRRIEESLRPSMRLRACLGKAHMQVRSLFYDQAIATNRQ